MQNDKFRTFTKDQIRPIVIRSLRRSNIRKKIAEYLFEISPSGSYTSEIAYSIKTTPTNVIGAIRGMGDRYKEDESLIDLGIVEQITKENRVSKETQSIEKLFEEIKKDGLATYGFHEVEEALSRGAVETLLISDAMVRSKNGERLLDAARITHCNFIIINTMHEAGKKFEGIGGVAALLRFKY